MCKHHHLDIKLYLFKLQRDYGIGFGFPKRGAKFSIDSESKLIPLKQKELCPLMFMDSQAQTYAPGCAVS